MWCKYEFFKAGVTILISYKVDFQAKFLGIKRVIAYWETSVQQEDIANVYSSNSRAATYMDQILIDGQTTSNTGKDVEKQEIFFIVGGNTKWYSHCEDSLEIPYKTKYTLTI